jgi:hypothetical protein
MREEDMAELAQSTATRDLGGTASTPEFSAAVVREIGR